MSVGRVHSISLECRAIYSRPDKSKRLEPRPACFFLQAGMLEQQACLKATARGLSGLLRLQRLRIALQLARRGGQNMQGWQPSPTGWISQPLRARASVLACQRA